MALWILPKRGLLCVGAKANVPLCGGKKLNKKMCGREKKKYRRVGKVCRLSSCPFVIWSVCLCLSVKMVYASLVCLTVTVRVARSVFTLAANGSRIWLVADFEDKFFLVYLTLKELQNLLVKPLTRYKLYALLCNVFYFLCSSFK